jgi:hypothetical protein
MHVSSPTGHSQRQLDPEIGTVLDAFNHLAEREPGLPGVRSLLAIKNANLDHGLTPGDLGILTGALYLEAERQLHASSPSTGEGTSVQATGDPSAPTRERPPITAADVKSALSEPIDTAPYGREYIDTLLRETKARLAVDSVFQKQLAGAEAAAARKTCLGGTPRWICGVIVIIIIIIIVVAV